jgi:acetyl esterase
VIWTIQSSRVFALLLLLLLSSSCTTRGQDAAAPPQPTTIAGAVTRVYKSIDGVDLRLHIFNPQNHDATSAIPAIVLFFGGGWTTGSVNQFVPQSKHLAQRGMIAIVADYRVFSRHKTSAFEAVADAKSAIRWLRMHATELGIDANRVAAGGGSSGGHIALSAAVIQRFDEMNEDQRINSKPDALALFNPGVDTSSPRVGELPDNVSQTLKERLGDRGRDVSPLHHLDSGLPPTLILHGKDDTTVPYTDVERFCSEARDRGNQCKLIGYAGAAHGFFNPMNAGGKWYRETLLEADRFLTQLRYLRPPVPAQIR